MTQRKTVIYSRVTEINGVNEFQTNSLSTHKSLLLLLLLLLLLEREAMSERVRKRQTHRETHRQRDGHTQIAQRLSGKRYEEVLEREETTAA